MKSMRWKRKTCAPSTVSPDGTPTRSPRNLSSPPGLALLAGNPPIDADINAMYVTFLNAANDHLDVYWQETFLAAMPPGGQHRMKTYLGHNWFIKKKNGDVAKEVRRHELFSTGHFYCCLRQVLLARSRSGSRMGRSRR